MSNIGEQITEHMYKPVRVYCKNSPPVDGILDGWVSEGDNEPDGECIYIDATDVSIEILVNDIIRIENAVG